MLHVAIKHNIKVTLNGTQRTWIIVLDNKVIYKNDLQDTIVNLTGR
jgi:hypothetical protein